MMLCLFLATCAAVACNDDDDDDDAASLYRQKVVYGGPSKTSILLDVLMGRRPGLANGP
jgi:hypothetical protein